MRPLRRFSRSFRDPFWSLLGLAVIWAGPFAFFGCARLQQVPYVGRVFKLKPRYYRYLSNSHFSFDYPRRWRQGMEIPGGVEFRQPEATASFSVAYLQPGMPGYLAPDAYRRQMTNWGSVEDPHLVRTVEVSSAPAFQVQFTTYEYDPEYLLGQKVQAWFSEVTLVPFPKGIFVVRYRATPDDFWKKRCRVPYEVFWNSLSLYEPKEDSQ